MKRIPSALCGLLMLLPLSAVTVYAQSTTANSPTASKPSQTKPSTPQSAPSPAVSAGAPSDPNAPPPPAHPITAEQTREILDLMSYKKMQDESWMQLISNNKQRAPFIPQDVWSDVQGGLSGIDYVAIIQPVYAKYLSTEDAAKALEFYRTPAGKRVLQAMPSILGESVAVSQQKGQQVGRDAIEKHRAEIEEAQKKYQAEHAPPTLGPGAGAPPSGGPSTAPSATPANPSTKPNGSAAKPGSSPSTPPPPQH